MMVWNACVEGTFANRNPDKGSWFLQEAIDEIIAHPDQELERTIKQVTRKASLEQRNARVGNHVRKTFPVPCRSHDTMTRDFIFQKRDS